MISIDSIDRALFDVVVMRYRTSDVSIKPNRLDICTGFSADVLGMVMFYLDDDVFG
mgnify:CR=1 FL=1